MNDNNDDNELRLFTSWNIVKGDYMGDMLGINQGLENPERLGFTKSFLAALNIDVDKLNMEDLEDVMGSLVKERITARLTTKMKDGYCNARLNRLVDIDDDDDSDDDNDTEPDDSDDDDDDDSDSDSDADDDDSDDDSDSDDDDDDRGGLAIGQAVDVVYEGEPWRGEITRISKKDNTCRVKFEDGTETVEWQDIEIVAKDSDDDSDDDSDSDGDDSDDDSNDDATEKVHIWAKGDCVSVDYGEDTYLGEIQSVKMADRTAKVVFDDAVETCSFDELTLDTSGDAADGETYRNPRKGDKVAFTVNGTERRGTVVKVFEDKQRVKVKSKKKEFKLDFDDVEILVDQKES